MKRSKDDKIMGPMFPRLHVNDTEKGGPRAPPRNKMALYEQLSIPSQRFKPGMTPLNQNNNYNASFTPPASSSQGNAHERGMYISVQVPPSGHTAEKPPNHGAPFSQEEQKKKLDEDDFTVPIFIQSKVGQECIKYHSRTNMDKLPPSDPPYSYYSMKLRSPTGDDPKQTGIMGARQNAKRPNEGNINDITGRKNLHEYSQHIDEAEGPLKQAANNFNIIQKADFLQTEKRADLQSGPIKGHVCNSQSVDVNHQNCSMSLRKFSSGEERNFDDTQSHEVTTCRSLRTNHFDRGDDASETSLIESISETDISPDDVVGIIGQKHFWKARSAIVKQQRAFAIQVFELHRLIKVQRLIAESPHVLLENSAYLGKPIRPSSVKKLSLEYIVKAPSNVPKHKGDSEKQSHKMESSAENTPEKASLSSVQNGGQAPNCRPFAGNTPVTQTGSDPNLGSWCSNPPQGHQWLIPVMSPTEGLVYKPYPGPGFSSPVCGGCGPPGSSPVMGNFLSPAYGVPASHHQYQGTGAQSFFPSGGTHGYFPPYGMPVMNPPISGHGAEQMSQFTAHGLQRQSSGGGANFKVQHHNPFNLSSQKSGANSDALKLNAPKDNELQVSTASSPTAQCAALDNTMDRSNVLSLFPTSPATDVPNDSPRRHEGDQPQVIRVVPHNRRSATESAARIFRSIQEERKHYDSV